MQYRHLYAESIGGIQWRASQSKHIASPDVSASGVATSSLGGLLAAVRAAALVAARAPAATPTAGPLSGSYLSLYATFTVLTSMDTFRNFYALFVV